MNLADLSSIIIVLLPLIAGTSIVCHSCSGWQPLFTVAMLSLPFGLVGAWLYRKLAYLLVDKAQKGNGSLTLTMLYFIMPFVFFVGTTAISVMVMKWLMGLMTAMRI